MSLPQRLRRPPQGTQWVLVRLATREVEVRGGTKCHPSSDRRRCAPGPSDTPRPAARQTRHTGFSHTSRSPSSGPRHPRKSLSPVTLYQPKFSSHLRLLRLRFGHYSFSDGHPGPISHRSCCDGNDKNQVWKVCPLPDRLKLRFFPGPNASYTLSPRSNGSAQSFLDFACFSSVLFCSSLVLTID